MINKKCYGIMKKTMFLVGLFSLFSCSLDLDHEKGLLCVKNESGSVTKNIESVYIKEKSENGYTLMWTGNLKTNFTQIINLNPGNYSCKISVFDNTNGKGEHVIYETGYNMYYDLKPDCYVDVIFDGEGIYFN